MRNANAIGMEQAIARGKSPWGSSTPPVYTCGACRSAQVNAGDGICANCRRIFENSRSGVSGLWVGFVTMVVVVMIAAVLFMTVTGR